MSGESSSSTDSRLFKKPGGKNYRKPQPYKIDATESSTSKLDKQNYIEHLEESLRYKQYELDKQKEQFIALRNELELSQEQLRQADKLNTLGMMAASIFHEIGNATTTIGVSAPAICEYWREILPVLHMYQKEKGTLYVNGMDCDTFCDEMLQLCSELGNGVSRIVDIIRGARDYMRDGAQKSLGEVKINNCVLRSIELTETIIKKSTDHLLTNLHSNLPSVKGDARQLEQVIVNLIINACQALSDRRNPIIVSTEFLADINMVELSVVNEGDTVPPEVIDRVFEPFFTTKRQNGGTGLGLYISRNILNEHNGSLHMEPLSEKSGTRVVMRLPSVRA